MDKEQEHQPPENMKDRDFWEVTRQQILQHLEKGADPEKARDTLRFFADNIEDYAPDRAPATQPDQKKIDAIRAALTAKDPDLDRSR